MEAKIRIEKKDFIKQGKLFGDSYLIDTKNVIYASETGYLTRCQNKATKIISAVKVIYKYMCSDLESFYIEIKKLKEYVLS